MTTAKIKIGDLAKDFDMKGKDLLEAYKAVGGAAKSTSQAVTGADLDLLFDYLTQKNQISSLAEVFAPAAKAAQERKEASERRILEQQQKKEEKKAEPKKDGKKPEARPEKKQGQASEPKTSEPQTLKKTPQIHHVDTRGSSVNIDRFDERMDTLVPDKVDRMAANQQQKQKLTSRRQQQNRKVAFQSNKRKQEEQEKLRKLQQQAMLKKIPLRVQIPDEINVGELAVRLKKTSADVIKKLMKLGVMANVSQSVDFDTASLVAMEFDAIVEHEVIRTIEERLIDESEDAEDALEPRAPVVVVMGHVDHGKTSLLDAIRETHVASGEAGGITQHIGAYRVSLKGRDITFLDTPGHEAFTSMRARGAQITDVAILVVAADDGVMPQTIEAIHHAKAAGTPIVVAINKMDKPGANPQRVMEELTKYDLVSEEWGGDTIMCQVSALKKEGIDNLLEMVLLTADMLELRANPNRKAKGAVVEAKLDKGRGPVATILIQNGMLHLGDIVIAGTSVGRVRAMNDDQGRHITEAGPSVPVEIVGLAEVPGAGDSFYAVEDERMARDLADQRRNELKKAQAASSEKVTLENLFSRMEGDGLKKLNIIVKADVQGSAEAVKASLEKLSNEEVKVQVIHSGIGGVNESDVMLAGVSDAIIVGFNVRPDAQAAANAAEQGVEIRLYRIIYDCINEIEAAMKGMLAPKFREVVIGHAEVRQLFKASGVGTIAGCYVKDGKMQRSESVRLVRDNIVVFEGALASLKRFKDDAKEVAAGYECGISLEKFNDIKEGDVIEAFVMEQIQR